MGILPILVIVFSALNDILDFATAWFPGLNEVITFIFATIIGILVFFEALQKKLANEKGVGKMVTKKMITLLAASLVESLPMFGLLPFHTIGAVFMAIIKPGVQKK
jgi:hypothetical protein